MMAMDPSIPAAAGASRSELHPFLQLRSSPALPPVYGRLRSANSSSHGISGHHGERETLASRDAISPVPISGVCGSG